MQGGREDRTDFLLIIKQSTIAGYIDIVPLIIFVS
jgi:hypothetical protein